MAVLSKFSEGSSSFTNDYKYDVFLSFRGVDTRYGFTDHLHKALLGANISTFLDAEEIETGQDLKPEMESAIKESRASIIVLSKNYANSSWCLNELVLILEQRMACNHIVIPIFYDVEPTHIKKQESTFGVQWLSTNARWGRRQMQIKRIQWGQKIDGWIQALAEVADIKGENAKGSCIEDISKRCANKFNGLLDLQEQLFTDISKRASVQVHDIFAYTSKIENAIARKRMFLVLDDIDSLDQLDALLGKKVFIQDAKS
ncbi:toll/interleukin-1 receptor-like protein [Lactuca sativa]|uniref:toll/interleukin-1 receptor-like protein n=1 Tax=Lactuca sativa TaxID=4236 RepID=UPI0022AF12F7|nr:toll/interleukin-1 receptor-like protein [Lactuca sativa]